MFDLEIASEVGAVVEAYIGDETGRLVGIPEGLLVEGVFGEHVGEEAAESYLSLRVGVRYPGVGGETPEAAMHTLCVEHCFDHRPC